MKKRAWKATAAEAERQRHAAIGQMVEAEETARGLAAEVRRLAAEVETMKANWSPVPITHPWQPRNPQCALCDEPRDSPRHADVDRDGARD